MRGSKGIKFSLFENSDLSLSVLDSGEGLSAFLVSDLFFLFLGVLFLPLLSFPAEVPLPLKFFILFLDLMTSVFRDIGLGFPCSFKNKPHALQRTCPASSLLQRGVFEVLQLLQTGELLL